jgi:hypothetical protein
VSAGIQLRGDKLFVPYLHAPGGVEIGREPDFRQQLFTHKTGATTRHFDVQTLERLISANYLAYRLEETEITKPQAAYIWRNHGIERASIQRLLDSPARLKVPGIFCVLEDATGILVDGNHRYVARDILGLRTIKLWVLDEAAWRLSLLAIPEGLFHG